MVDIKMKGRQANIGWHGSVKNVAMEVSAAISGIYQGMHSTDPQDADMFKSMMQRAMEDDSPVWRGNHEMTMVVIPEIK